MCLGGNKPTATTTTPPPAPPPPPPTLQNPAVVNKDNPSSLSSQARFRNSLRIDLGGLAAPAAENGPGSLFINPTIPSGGS